MQSGETLPPSPPSFSSLLLLSPSPLSFCLSEAQTSAALVELTAQYTCLDSPQRRPEQLHITS